MSSELIDLLVKIKNKDMMKDFLLGILSPRELEEISTRLKIVKMLKQGITHHEIASELGVGVSTVSRGSRELQKGRFKVVN